MQHAQRAAHKHARTRVHAHARVHTSRLLVHEQGQHRTHAQQCATCPPAWLAAVPLLLLSMANKAMLV